MASRKSATEPLQDNVVNAELVKQEDATDIIQEKVISKDDRVVELQLMLDGLTYRRKLAAQKAADDIASIQNKLTNLFNKYDQVEKEFKAELAILQGKEND